MTLPAGVALRPAVPDDAEAGADLHIACWREAYGPLVGRDLLESRLHDRAHWVAAWEQQLASGPPRTVAETGDQLVGFAVTGATRDGGKESGAVAAYELLAIYTRAAFWGSGVGQTLLDAVLPGDSISLWVLEDNERARGFYRRNGFVPDGAREHYAGLDSWEIRMVRQ
jgi:ribosomal protein S18 acetylase RimI-like enzyme